MAAEAPKYGGTLTFMIPADSLPSFDAQREETCATIHSAAPFCSTLIRINPNPGSTTDIVCDLCTEMPKPTDRGKTYTIAIRDDVKFHNGDKLTAEDVAACMNKIAFPPAGTLSPRSTDFMMVDKIEAPDEHTVVIHLKFATSAFLPAPADPYNWTYQKKSSTKTSIGTSTTSSAPGHSNSPDTTLVCRSGVCATPLTIIRAALS